MFTGIVEAMGEVTAIEKEGTNVHMRIKSNLARELHVDQSMSHDGVCLTVTKADNDGYTVTMVDETLKKSKFGEVTPGDKINLERSMASGGRFDGHIVQGHVDMVGECISVEEADGSWVYRFRYKPDVEHIVVEKGSICVNGISLTCFECTNDMFSVAIIPYTYENTNIQDVKSGTKVNLEFDVIGKYVARILSMQRT